MMVMSARSTGGKEGRGDSCNRQHLTECVFELRCCIEVQVAAPQGLVVLRIAVVFIEVSIIIRHDGCCAAGEDAAYDPAGSALVKGLPNQCVSRCRCLLRPAVIAHARGRS